MRATRNATRHRLRGRSRRSRNERGCRASAHARRDVRANRFALCGPNCVGVINAAMPAASTFSTALLEIDALQAGGISMVCQSGGIATTAFSMVLQAGFGFRYLVSSGNEAIVDFADYLNAFAEDPGTQIIGGYLEGIKDGERSSARLPRRASAANRWCSSRPAPPAPRRGRRRRTPAHWSAMIASSTPSSRRWASCAHARSRSSSTCAACWSATGAACPRAAASASSRSAGATACWAPTSVRRMG